MCLGNTSRKNRRQSRITFHKIMNLSSFESRRIETCELIRPMSTVVGIFRGIFEGRIEETSGSVFLENEIAVGMRESIYCLQ